MRPTAFQPLPDGEPLRLAWPSGRRDLRRAPDRYFAATRANPRYGRPGWTRDAGRRFHRGCDIAPLVRRAAGRTVTVLFTDPATGREYPAAEPAWVPEDDAWAVCDGVVEEAVGDETRSALGRHVLLRHRWPRGGQPFFTLYAHLAGVAVRPGESVGAGDRLGRLGGSSNSAGARDWLAIAPHLHFEAWDEARRPYDPAAFLLAFLPADERPGRG